MYEHINANLQIYTLLYVVILIHRNPKVTCTQNDIRHTTLYSYTGSTDDRKRIFPLFYVSHVIVICHVPVVWHIGHVTVT